MTTSLIDREPAPQLAGVIVPSLGDDPSHGPVRVQETEGLVEALGVDLAFTLEQRVRSPNAGRLFGAGQLDAIKDQLDDHRANLLVVDCNLSPVQQRNLERELGVKVMDRTGLILEIFGVRARSAEGRLQVEMARILYERSRLVRTWTHLERQRGGTGFLAGPGESQLESDRRMLDRRIARLKADLEVVRRTRHLQRTGRRRRGAPIVALVGYTNAGKSTLFNRLTHSSVLAADMPFATLDPTARDIELPSGRTVSMIDTVGFITDLPTHLIESFRATIEEAIEADLLLHVRDISHEDSARQAHDVDVILRQLEEQTKLERPPILEVWNKADLLSADMREAFQNSAERDPDSIMVSSVTGQGIDDLLDAIQANLFSERRQFSLRIPFSAARARAWLHSHCEVLSETALDENRMLMEVLMSPAELGKLFHDEDALDPDTVLGADDSSDVED